MTCGSRALLPTACGPQHDVERRSGGRSRGAAHEHTVGRDHERLRLAHGAEVQRCLFGAVQRDRPRDLLRRDVPPDGGLFVLAHDAEHRKVALTLVRVVERLQRRCFLMARNAPAVEEIHDVGFPCERRGVDELVVERRHAELRHVSMFLHETWHRRLIPMLDGEHDAERDQHRTDHERDPARRQPHQDDTSASGTDCSSSFGSVTVSRATGRRRRVGMSATAVPSTMMRPPIQSHITIVPTCTPIVTRPDVGDDVSVRYQSRHGLVRIDGVPMPSAAFGNVEIAGANEPTPPMRTCALIVVFCGDRSTSRSRNVTLWPSTVADSPGFSCTSRLVVQPAVVASATATPTTPRCTSSPPYNRGLPRTVCAVACVHPSSLCTPRRARTPIIAERPMLVTAKAASAKAST